MLSCCIICYNFFITIINYASIITTLDVSIFSSQKSNYKRQDAFLRQAGEGEVLLERDGSVIPDQVRKLCRREEYFKEYYQAAPPNAAFSPPPTSSAETYPCEVDPSTREEVCTAIRQLRNNRSPGEDGIPAEAYKTCLDSLGPWLHRVITKVRLCEAVPNNWSEAVLLSLFKKGDK